MTQRKTYRDAYKRVTGHQLYQKMSLLELEKVRRQKELAALERRVNTLRQTLADLEGELTTARNKIATHLQETAQQEGDTRQPVPGRLGAQHKTSDRSEHFDVGRFLFKY